MSPDISNNFLPESFNIFNHIVNDNDTSNGQYIVRYDGDGLVLSIPEDVLLGSNGSLCHNFSLDINTDCDYLDLGMRVFDAINCVFRGHFVVDKQLAYRFLQVRALSCGYGWVGLFECVLTDFTSLFVRYKSLGETFANGRSAGTNQRAGHP